MNSSVNQAFKVVDNILYIEGVSSIELAEKFGTPLYITSKYLLDKNAEAYMRAFPSSKCDLLYAVKANNNITLMKILAKKGFGADVFSDGELYMAMLAGFNKEKVLFNGNSKSYEEISMGVQAGVPFSVDSLDELETISKLADKMNKTVKIAFRINPDISPKTHPKIATGLKTSKFGLPWDQAVKAYEVALKMPGIEPVGIHCHIGSQITDISPFVEAVKRIFEVAYKVEEIGVEFEFVDIGGGLGIDYEGKGAPTPKEFAEEILPIFEECAEKLNSNPKLWLEPGRSIVGNTTVLLTKVNAVKKAYKNFVAVDAGFNLLIRPAMYGSYHRIAVANKMSERAVEKYTVVGPICESGDVLGEDRLLPKVEKGDLIVVFDAGAYGFSMSSQYNGRRRCAEVLVEGEKCYLIRERERYSDLIANQIIPAHLGF